MKNFVAVILIIIAFGAGYIWYQNQQTASLNNEGAALLEQGKYEEAVATLEQAYSKDSDNKSIRENLARAYMALGNMDKARSVAPAFTQLQEAQTAPTPDDEGADNEKAPSAHYASELDVTQAQLQKNAQKRIERMKAEGWKKEEGVTKKQILDLAFTYEHMGDQKRAVLMLERALFVDPDDLKLERRIEWLEKQDNE
ncbi:MAG: tetratricopeptide repeat protein [Candidatus Sumerlaeia bacterium]